jgi:hypothetical protein
MRPIYRITRQEAGSPSDLPSDILERLKRLLPAETAALYTAGVQLMVAGQSGNVAQHPNWFWGWALFCAAFIVVSRFYGTRDVALGEKADYIHIAISVVAFGLYVFIYPTRPHLGLGLPSFAAPLVALGFTALAALYPGPPAPPPTPKQR